MKKLDEVLSKRGKLIHFKAPYQRDIPPFIQQTESGDIVRPPALARYFQLHQPYLLVADRTMKEPLVYLYDEGVYRLALPRIVKGRLKAYIDEYDPDLVKMRNVNEAYNLILSDTDFIGVDELNAAEDLINFKNGLLRVSATTTELLPHSPNVYSTIQLPCEWVKRAEPTPVFDRYLNTLTGGDSSVARLLLQFLGVAVSNIRGYRMKKALFLLGKSDSGKSQLRALANELIGPENCSGANLTTIGNRFGTSVTYGKRLVGSADLSASELQNADTFKELTGGDLLFAEIKGVQGFDYVFNGLLFFCANQLPSIKGNVQDEVYNRMMIVRCDNAIPKHAQDKHLLEKMLKERNGIMRKLIKALQEVIKNGYQFDEPASVVAERNRYRRKNRNTQAFFSECMQELPDNPPADKCSYSRIYEVYQAWCMHNGCKPLSQYEFRRAVSEDNMCDYSALVHTVHGLSYFRHWAVTQDAQIQFASMHDKNSNVRE